MIKKPLKPLNIAGIPSTMTTSELAEAIGVGPERIRQLEQQGHVLKVERDTYNTVASIRGIMAHKKRQVYGDAAADEFEAAGEFIDEQAEQIERLKSQVERLELKILDRKWHANTLADRKKKRKSPPRKIA